MPWHQEQRPWLLVAKPCTRHFSGCKVLNCSFMWRFAASGHTRTVLVMLILVQAFCQHVGQRIFPGERLEATIEENGETFVKTAFAPDPLVSIVSLLAGCTFGFITAHYANRQLAVEQLGTFEAAAVLSAYITFLSARHVSMLSLYWTQDGPNLWYLPVVLQDLGWLPVAVAVSLLDAIGIVRRWKVGIFCAVCGNCVLLQVLRRVEDPGFFSPVGVCAFDVPCEEYERIYSTALTNAIVFLLKITWTYVRLGADIACVRPRYQVVFRDDTDAQVSRFEADGRLLLGLSRANFSMNVEGTELTYVPTPQTSPTTNASRRVKMDRTSGWFVDTDRSAATVRLPDKWSSPRSLASSESSNHGLCASLVLDPLVEDLQHEQGLAFEVDMDSDVEDPADVSTLAGPGDLDSHCPSAPRGQAHAEAVWTSVTPVGDNGAGPPKLARGDDECRDTANQGTETPRSGAPGSGSSEAPGERAREWDDHPSARPAARAATAPVSAGQDLLHRQTERNTAPKDLLHRQTERNTDCGMRGVGTSPAAADAATPGGSDSAVSRCPSPTSYGRCSRRQPLSAAGAVLAVMPAANVHPGTPRGRLPGGGNCAQAMASRAVMATGDPGRVARAPERGSPGTRDTGPTTSTLRGSNSELQHTGPVLPIVFRDTDGDGAGSAPEGRLGARTSKGYTAGAAAARGPPTLDRFTDPIQALVGAEEATEACGSYYDAFPEMLRTVHRPAPETKHHNF